MKVLSDPKREQAAQLIAEGRFEFGEVAEKVGVDRVTLYRWKRDKRFTARVEQIIADHSRATKRLAIARKDYRVGVLNKLHTKLETLIEQRAADPSTANIPGGDQGLVVRQFKVSGENVVSEYVFDRAVLQELRAVQEQAAKELGQFVEKHEHKIGSLKDLSDDELAALLGELDDSPEAESEDSRGDRNTEEAKSSS